MTAARRMAAIGAVAAAVALVAVPAAGARAKARAVPDTGLVTLGKVRCTATEACAVKAQPRQVKVRVAGKAVRAKVVVPGVLGAGGEAVVTLRFGSGALERLAGHTATFRAKVVVRGSGKRSTASFTARLKRPAAPAAKSPGNGGNSSGGGAGAGNGAPNGSGARSEPIAGEPAPLARPLTAVTVSAVTLTWYPRDSFVRYVSSGTGAEDGVRASGGATALSSETTACVDRPESTGLSLPYTIQFTPTESWYDPASGQAAIDGTGSVTFRYRSHTINLTGSEPEIQIAGAASQAVFRFSGSEGTSYPDQRVALLKLDASGRPTVTDEGKTLTYELMRGTLTESGEKVFAGFYTAPSNNQFGCVSASFTLP